MTKKIYTTFLGYRIYRKKFLRTLLIVILLTVPAFVGINVFFLNIWMNESVQKVQERYLEGEQKIKNIESMVDEFVNELYGNKALLQDTMDLMYAENEKEYTEARKKVSLATDYQIGYVPNGMKRLFQLNGINGVILRRQESVKTIRRDWISGDMKLSFGLPESETGSGFGNFQAASCTVRDPRYVDQLIGTFEFYMDSSKLYRQRKDNVSSWNLTSGETVLEEHLQTEKAGGWLKSAAEKEEPYGWIYENGWNRVYYIRLESAQADYTYTAVIDRMELLKENHVIIFTMLTVFSLLAVAAVFTTFLGIREDARFLKSIMRILQALEGGHFDEMKKLEVPAQHQQNEYGMIAVALKDVGLKMEQYIEREYILKLKEQETAMRALQHQINPHFLYNTLEAIRSKALLKDDRETADAIALLGTLYRARIHKSEMITLKEEFELLEIYLQIMRLRFGDCFLYQAELDPGIENLKTVNFWMQPLAENFFTHGFDRNSEFNLLVVNGRREEEGVQIDIIDNGRGIAPKELEQIRKNMYEGSDDPDADIGLRNVYMRLRYFYGEGFQMEIDNNAEGGVFISIFIPGKAGKECTPY